jgi:hypothetical protein
MLYQSPTIAWRGKLAHLVAQVQEHKPQHGEQQGTLRCICGGTVHFHIQATGASRGQCSAGCGVRWSQ